MANILAVSLVDMGGFKFGKALLFQFIAFNDKMSCITTDLRFKVILMFDDTAMKDMHKESERTLKRLLEN